MANPFQDNRPDPEKLLSKLEELSRPRLRVYIGAAPGVGKTYQMLEDANLLCKQGQDVVIGFVETFDRVDTQAQIRDLPIIPRKKIEYRGVILEEMDLDSILERKPQICIVDELAHTNVVGSKNKKRYEDVLDLLNSGINVLTAVNIQHLETLNDTVMKSSGIKVRETVPDAFFERADEIINVDISVDELRKRLEQGKVYKPEKINQALNNFFKIDNLSTLRELALRTVAEQVSVKSAQYREREGLEPAIIPEKLMVCISSNQTVPKLIRTAARISSRIGAHWYAVYVETTQENPENIKPADARQLAKNIELAEELGATVVKLKTPNVANGLILFAQREGITHVVFGQSARTRWQLILYGSVIDRFLDEVKDATVQVVPTTHTKTKTKTKNFYDYLNYIVTISGQILIAIVMKAIHVNNTTVALIFLLFIQVSASIGGLTPSIVAAIIATLCFNYFFLPPVGTFTISDPQNWVALSAFTITAVITSQLSSSAKNRAEDAEKRREDVWRLYELGRTIIATPDSETAISTIARQVVDIFKLDYCSIYTPDKESKLQRLVLAANTTDITSSIKPELLNQVAESAEVQLTDSNYYPSATEIVKNNKVAYIPLRIGIKVIGVMVVIANNLEGTTLEAIAGLVALALERARFLKEVSYTERLRESDKLKSALLASVSHNLRTPLTSIRTSIDSLIQNNIFSWPKETVNEFLSIINEETHRLSQTITNLLEMARIEAGELKVNKTWTTVSELFSNALQRCTIVLKDYDVKEEIPEDLPLVKIDSILLEEVLVSLLENAAKYSPVKSTICLSAKLENGHLIIGVIDQGRGIALEEQNKIFDKFYRAKSTDQPAGLGMGLAIARGIVEIHKGKIWVESDLGKGASFYFSLPVECKNLSDLIPKEIRNE